MVKTDTHNYLMSFKRFNIELNFTDNALKEVSKKAHEENIGARALSSTLEKVFREFKFELPSTKVFYILATNSLIKDPIETLKKYLKNPNKQIKSDIQKTIEYEIEKSKKPVKDTAKILEECLLPENKGNILLTIKKQLNQHVTSN